MKRLLKQVFAVLSIAVLIGAGMVIWHVWPREQRFYSDADTIQTSEEAAVIREILWQPPVPLSAVLNTATDDYEPQLSSDGGVLFFVRGKAGQNANIYYCQRMTDGWGEPQPLAAVNTSYDELGPELSADGKTLYFYSDRLGGNGGYDLWVSRLGDNGWREPTNLGPNVNSPFNDYGPALSPNGVTLYFSSNRPRPGDANLPTPYAWSATLREERHQRDYDLYMTSITDGGAAAAAPLVGLNTEFNDGSPAVSSYGDFLYFASDRPGGFGRFDLYRSRRLHGEHEPVSNLGSTVNTPANELDPDLSLGGYALHFSSDREVDEGRTTGETPVPQFRHRPVDGDDSPADYNLYHTTSREVFREVRTHRASIDWAGLWREIGPNLMWALLALLLTLLLLALLRDFRERRMGLLTRCLLASLLVHLLLLLLMNVVEVSTGIANVLRGRGKIQVALLSSASGDEIASQIRGGLTEIDIPAPVDSALEQAVLASVVEAFDAATELYVEQATVELDETPVAVESPRDASQPENEPLRPLDVDARSATIKPAAMADVAVPTEAMPIEAVENHEPTRPTAVAKLSKKAPASAITTTQPAIPVVDVVLKPDRMGLAAAELDDRPASTDTPRDSPRPTSEPLRSLDVNVHPAAMAAAATVELAMPTESAPIEIAENREPTPVVAAAAPGPVRLAADAAVGRLVDTQAATGQVRIRPQSASHDWSESPVSDATVRLAADAMPVGQATAPISLQEVDASRPRLDDIVMPVVPTAAHLWHRRLAGGEAATDRSPRVCVAQLDRERADVAVPSGAEPASSTDELVLLRPAGRPQLGAQPSDVLADAPPPRDAMTAAIPARFDRAGTTFVAIGDSVRLDLGLPTETEPPGRHELPGNAIGTIRGHIVDVESGEPLAEVAVRLVLPDDDTVSVTTDEDGAYEMIVPSVPEFFALSASLPDYVPDTANIPAAMLSGRPLTVDFELARQTEWVVALEDEPDVHHLGNDRFEGRINSQFQKSSEGKTFRGKFEITLSQLPPHCTRAEVWLMAKGVQCPHQIRINGRRLRGRLDESPDDGSFGSFQAEFDPSWLEAGTNTIKIRAVSCSGDLDDFEFVNVQVRLWP